MKYYKKMFLVTAIAGLLALALRLWQQFAGFEADTGLAVSGHPAAIALAAVLAAAAVVLVVLSRKLPGGRDAGPFEQAFSTESAAQLTLIVMGIFLMAAGGALQVLFAVMGGLQSVMQEGGMMVAVVWMGTVSPREVMILGILAVVSAVCLFPPAAACRRHEDRPGRSVNGNILLVPVVLMVVRLVMLYRINSVDPVLQAYYVELLAVVFVTLAFYHLAGFAFGMGSLRWYAVCSGLAVVLCIATLADGHDVSGMLFYAGCALSLLGFWLLYRNDEPVTEV